MLVADDNETYRHALLMVLGGVPSLEVVGQAASGDECLRLAETLSPDVVLLDVNMPQQSGIEVARRLKSSEHPPQVVILSLSDAGDGRAAALSAGADAYVPKAAALTQLVPLLTGYPRHRHPGSRRA
ncbi:MAG TPA: response regulator transcription factor [Steroidobacteraceae bacterium]|nr:response regulator transcription factor [Steroidobacteraceae bacterium]